MRGGKRSEQRSEEGVGAALKLHIVNLQTVVGRTRLGNEEPGTGGLDRCTYVGITGPALPCGFGQTRGTRLNQIDRCYVAKTREVIKKADMVLVD